MSTKKVYQKDRITIQQQHRFNEVKSYRDYIKQKKKIQEKYPKEPWVNNRNKSQGNYKEDLYEGWWEDWLSYKKDITDLLLKPNGSYQKFIWDTVSEKDELQLDIFMRGRFNVEYKYKNKDE